MTVLNQCTPLFRCATRREPCRAMQSRLRLYRRACGIGPKACGEAVRPNLNGTREGKPRRSRNLVREDEESPAFRQGEDVKKYSSFLEMTRLRKLIPNWVHCIFCAELSVVPFHSSGIPCGCQEALHKNVNLAFPIFSFDVLPLGCYTV
jgi:hypothetical protein